MIHLKTYSRPALAALALALAGFGTASGQEKVSYPDSLKITCVKEKSAAPLPELQRQGLRPPMQSDDPKDVFLGKTVYFDLHKGNEIHYTVESSVPLTKFVYTGTASKNFSIQIHDETGLSLGSCGPYNFGNIIKTFELPLPGTKRLEVIITDHSREWLLVKELSFETGPVAPLH